MIAEAKAAARVEADKMIENARVAIENEKNSAMVELKNQVATLSLEIAEKVVKERLSDQGEQEKLVSVLMQDVDLN